MVHTMATNSKHAPRTIRTLDAPEHEHKRSRAILILAASLIGVWLVIGGLSGGWLKVAELLLVLVQLSLLGFWLWMVMDVFRKHYGAIGTIGWILGMVCFHVFWSVLYYFIRYRPAKQASRVSG